MEQVISAQDAQASAEGSEAPAWNLRASAWELLSLSLRYPEDALVDALVSGEWADAAEEIAGALGGDLQLVPMDCQQEDFLSELRTESTRLLIGPPKPAVTPYEGAWRAEQEGVQALLFINPHSDAVWRFCRQCGLARPAGQNDPLDYVATECELMEYLSALNAGMSALPESVSAEAFPGGSVSAAYAAFKSDHVDAWLVDFFKALAAESRIPFYRNVAYFALAVLPAL